MVLKLVICRLNVSGLHRVCNLSSGLFSSVEEIWALIPKPSSHIRWISCIRKVRSRVTIIVSCGRKVRSDSHCSADDDVSCGTIWILDSLSILSWFSTSNVRSESISSPKKSMRYGCSHEKLYTSISEPRRANCPGS